MGRLAPELGGQLARGRHVAGHREQPGLGPVPVAEHARRDGHEPAAPRRRPVHELAVAGRLALEERLDVGARPARRPARVGERVLDHVPEGAAERVGGRDPVEPLGPGVPVRDPALEVERDDGVRDLGEHVGLELRLLLGLAPGRDVADGRHPDLAAAVRRLAALGLDPEPGPVGPDGDDLVGLGPSRPDRLADGLGVVGVHERRRGPADGLRPVAQPEQADELVVAVDDAAVDGERDPLRRRPPERPEPPLALGERPAPEVALDEPAGPLGREPDEVGVAVGERAGGGAGRREAEGPPHGPVDDDRRADVGLEPLGLVARVVPVLGFGHVVDRDDVVGPEREVAVGLAERERGPDGERPLGVGGGARVDAALDAGEEPDVEPEQGGHGGEHDGRPVLERAVDGRHVEEPVEPVGLAGQAGLGPAEVGDVDGHAGRPRHAAGGVERGGGPRLVVAVPRRQRPRPLLACEHAPEPVRRRRGVGVEVEHVAPHDLAGREPERLQPVPLREREHAVGVEGVEDERGPVDDGLEPPAVVLGGLGPGLAVELSPRPRGEHADQVVVGLRERGGERGPRRERKSPPRGPPHEHRDADVGLEPERLVARVPPVGRDGHVVDLEDPPLPEREGAVRVAEGEPGPRREVGPVARGDGVVRALDPAEEADVEPEQRSRERERLAGLVLEREVALGRHRGEQPEPVGVAVVAAGEPAPARPDVADHAAAPPEPERDPERGGPGPADAERDAVDAAAADARDEGLGRRGGPGGEEPRPPPDRVAEPRPGVGTGPVRLGTGSGGADSPFAPPSRIPVVEGVPELVGNPRPPRRPRRPLPPRNRRPRRRRRRRGRPRPQSVSSSPKPNRSDVSSSSSSSTSAATGSGRRRPRPRGGSSASSSSAGRDRRRGFGSSAFAAVAFAAAGSAPRVRLADSGAGGSSSVKNPVAEVRQRVVLVEPGRVVVSGVVSFGGSFDGRGAVGFGGRRVVVGGVVHAGGDGGGDLPAGRHLALAFRGGPALRRRGGRGGGGFEEVVVVLLGGGGLRQVDAEEVPGEVLPAVVVGGRGGGHAGTLPPTAPRFNRRGSRMRLSQRHGRLKGSLCPPGGGDPGGAGGVRPVPLQSGGRRRQGGVELNDRVEPLGPAQQVGVGGEDHGLRQGLDLQDLGGAAVGVDVQPDRHEPAASARRTAGSLSVSASCLWQ